MNLKRLLVDPKETRFEEGRIHHTDPAVVSNGWVFKEGACFRLSDFEVFTRKDKEFPSLYKLATNRGTLFRIGKLPHTTLLINKKLGISFLV